MMCKKSILGVVIVCFGLTILTSIAQAAEVKWKIIEPISDNVTISASTSITLDTSDKVHVLFSDANDLRYLTNAGASGDWSTKTIDANKGKPQGDIITDSTGVAHISYYVPSPSGGVGALMYATDANGTFVSSTIESGSSGNGVGQDNSIALDGNSTLHVSYYDSENKQLKHAHKKFPSGSWALEVVDSGNPGNNVGQYSSIAVDDNNTLHVSYYDITSKQLKYAKKSTTGSWVPEVVDSGAGGDVGQYSSIAVESNGKINISYYDFANDQLKYATYANGSWSNEVVDDSGGLGGVGQYCSITSLGDGSKVAISYYDSTNKTLKYAEGSAGNWTISTIDSQVNSGKYSAIAFDSSGHSYISYYTDNGTAATKLRIAYQYDVPPPVVIPPGGSGGGGSCFLTSVFMGTPFESALGSLRKFRDKILNKFWIGRQITNAYYVYSPQAVQFMRGRSGDFHNLVYWCLVPVVGVAWVLQAFGGSLLFILIGVLACLSIKMLMPGKERSPQPIWAYVDTSPRRGKTHSNYHG